MMLSTISIYNSDVMIVIMTYTRPFQLAFLFLIRYIYIVSSMHVGGRLLSNLETL